MVQELTGKRQTNRGTRASETGVCLGGGRNPEKSVTSSSWRNQKGFPGQVFFEFCFKEPSILPSVH